MGASIGDRLDHQSRNPDEIIFGQDFLSLFMTEKAASIPIESTTIDHIIHTTESIPDEQKPIIRDSRSSIYSYHFDLNDNKENNLNDNNNNNNSTTIPLEDEVDSVNDTKILSVRISSSVESQIHKEVADYRNLESTTTVDFRPLASTQHVSQDEPVPSLIEQRDTINSQSSKSILNIEEMEPITIINNNENMHKEIHQLKQNTNILGANPDYLQQQKYKQLHPRHHHHHPYRQHSSVVFHGQSKDNNRARSVSYSSVIQNLQDNPITSSQQIIQTAESIERPTYAIQGTHDLQKTQYEKPYSQQNWSPRHNYHGGYVAQPEQNYEVDESVSLMTNGRTHGVQQVEQVEQSSPPSELVTQSAAAEGTTDNNHKVGYVVEGRNFRKYRVEERTSDGFIVGEYGVVSHDDGSLRGVRYTADGTINPRLIYDALMKFLSL